VTCDLLSIPTPSPGSWKEDGFEIAANAGNGLEAAKMIKEHQIDVRPLDIHMPRADRREYL
jgi:DNA-binding NarL/FixJ family response regulator